MLCYAVLWGGRLVLGGMGLVLGLFYVELTGSYGFFGELGKKKGGREEGEERRERMTYRLLPFESCLLLSASQPSVLSQVRIEERRLYGRNGHVHINHCRSELVIELTCVVLSL